MLPVFSCRTKGRMIRLKPQLGFLPVFFCLTSTAGAWGPLGHRLVGEMAWGRLNAEARLVVDRLLESESLAQAGTWADRIRSDPRWKCADPFHHTTVPQNETDRPNSGAGDVLGAIVFFQERLADTDAVRSERAAALRFLVHLIADIHQPLHVGYACDRGGNRVRVEWQGQPSNLHSVWDSAVIRSFARNRSDLFAILARLTAEEFRAMEDSGPGDWALESHELLDEVYRCHTVRDGCPCLRGDCQDGYSDFNPCLRPAKGRTTGPPVALGTEYRERAQPIAARRIVEAAVRLAKILNGTLSDEPLPAPFEDFKKRIQSESSGDRPFSQCLSEG